MSRRAARGKMMKTLCGFCVDPQDALGHLGTNQERIDQQVGGSTRKALWISPRLTNFIKRSGNTAWPTTIRVSIKFSARKGNPSGIK
ncbi:MAG: hypothetical protein COV67_02635 [Nitrospinae bacterium CG11_big_fil_rev_8_21_14_0_20_56_8]|nr:MAG: hypothetical protein COV67_02635 [Nitrospinae bacterium CG11_big_fil_rev_8_21_14_0_20_56_8]